jgi:hypothetical protein
MRNSLFGVLAFGLAFVVNPAFLATGCGLGPDFSEKEAVAVVAVAGAHRTYAFSHGGASYELVVDVAQSDKKLSMRGDVGFVGAAHACGERTFVKSASACLDLTKIPVTGTVSLTRDKKDAVLDHVAVSGVLTEYGTSLAQSSLELRTTSGASIALFSKDARVFSLQGVKADAIQWSDPNVGL